MLAFLCLKWTETLTGISIHSDAEIGPGLYIGHFGGVVIGGGVRMGSDCSVSHGVTLGDHGGSPVIGSGVFFGPGAKVFGPVSIGDFAVIGANAVVTRDVPARSTAVGVPAQARQDGGNARPGRLGHGA